MVVRSAVLYPGLLQEGSAPGQEPRRGLGTVVRPAVLPQLLTRPTLHGLFSETPQLETIQGSWVALGLRRA